MHHQLRTNEFSLEDYGNIPLILYMSYEINPRITIQKLCAASFYERRLVLKKGTCRKRKTR